MTPNLIVLTDPASPAAEAYRRLRVNLTAAAKAASLHTILMVAAGPDDAKAQAVANLAVSFARVGSRVILADCDLRQPGQHALFGLDNVAGVTTALSDPRGALPLQATVTPPLRVLTSGPAIATPGDAIASPAMAELLARLRAEADIVLLDAPPVTSATDALELARHVDGVLLMANAGHTRREEVQRAKEQLAQVGANLLGAVLINVAA